MGENILRAADRIDSDEQPHCAIVRGQRRDVSGMGLEARLDGARLVCRRQLVADHGVELLVFGGEEPVERLGLPRGARKTVEDESAAAMQAAASLADQTKDDVVGNGFAALHAGMSPSHRRTGSNHQTLRGTKHIVDGQVAGPERPAQEFGLGAFADSGWAEQDQPPGPVHKGRGLEANSIATLQPSRAVTHWGHARDYAPFEKPRPRRYCRRLRFY